MRLIHSAQQPSAREPDEVLDPESRETAVSLVTNVAVPTLPPTRAVTEAFIQGSLTFIANLLRQMGRLLRSLGPVVHDPRLYLDTVRLIDGEKWLNAASQKIGSLMPVLSERAIACSIELMIEHFVKNPSEVALNIIGNFGTETTFTVEKEDGEIVRYPFFVPVTDEKTPKGLRVWLPVGRIGGMVKRVELTSPHPRAQGIFPELRTLAYMAYEARKTARQQAEAEMQNLFIRRSDGKCLLEILELGSGYAFTIAPEAPRPGGGMHPPTGMLIQLLNDRFYCRGASRPGVETRLKAEQVWIYKEDLREPKRKIFYPGPAGSAKAQLRSMLLGALADELALQLEEEGEAAAS